MTRGKDQTRPLVVITGSGRSGTTWLAKLIDSHPDVVYRHEPDSVYVNGKIPFLPRPDQVDKFQEAAAQYLRDLSRARNLKSVGHAPFFRKNYRTRLEQAAYHSLIYAGKGMEKITSTLPAKFATPFVIPELADRRAVERALALVKTVDSLCRTYLFSVAAPSARFIHIIRHPGGVVASRLRGQRERLMTARVFLNALFNSGDAANHAYTFEDIASRSIEEQITFQWLVQNDKVFREMKNSSRYFPVIYEDLCLDAVGVTKKLIAFCGLDWHGQTEDFIRSLETRSTSAGYFNIMRSPKDAADQWRGELAPDVQHRIEILLEGTMLGSLVARRDPCAVGARAR